MPIRFARHVDRGSDDGCWPWTAARDRDGYGVINDDQDRYQRANRVAYELAHGPIPPGLQVLHRCDNPPCVNPAHLFLGTADDNNRDMAAKGRSTLGARHWKAGRWSKGTTFRTIAAQFQVTPKNVADIVHRKRWRHVQ